MSYSWGKRELLLAKEELSDLIKQTQDTSEQVALKSYLDSLNSFIFLHYTPVRSFSFSSFQNRLANFYNSFLFNRQYLDLVEKIYGIMLNSKFSLTLKEFYKFQQLFEFSTDYDPDEIVEWVFEFYRGHFPDSALYFKDFYENRRSLINIPKLDDKIFSEGNAFCFFVSGLNRPFVSTNSGGKASLIADLAHEFGHAYVGFKNREETESLNLVSHCEVESCFPEIIALEEASNSVISKDVASYYIFLMAKNVFEIADDFVLANTLSKFWEANGYRFDIRFILNLLKSRIPFSDVRAVVKKSVKESSPYVISFPIVMELYHIYKSNPEEAIQLYRNIMDIAPTHDSFKEILKLMNPTEHFEEELENISDNFSLVLKKITRK